MGPINNSVSYSGFPVGMNEFPASGAKGIEQALGLNNDGGKVFDSAGCHFSVGDGTRKSTLDSALIDSFQFMRSLMLDSLPEKFIPSFLNDLTMRVQDIDRQEGLSAFLLREVVINKLAPMALGAGVGSGVSKLVQVSMLDPIGLVEDAKMVGSGLGVIANLVLQKTCDVVMPEAFHGNLVNDFSKSFIQFSVNNPLITGEAIRNFGRQLADGLIEGLGINDVLRDVTVQVFGE